MIESQVLERTTADLIEHLGSENRVTVPQRLLVLRLRCALKRYLRGGEDDIQTLDKYIYALQNSLRLNLLAIGLERRSRRPEHASCGPPASCRSRAWRVR
jgi:hypothetical protein